MDDKQYGICADNLVIGDYCEIINGVVFRKTMLRNTKTGELTPFTDKEFCKCKGQLFFSGGYGVPKVCIECDKTIKEKN